MSKKQLHSRLENLFATLETDDGFDLPSEDMEANPGWTWECDASGNFLVCSPEVSTAIGFLPHEITGQSLFTFGLTSDSKQAMKRILAKAQFPAETQLSYQTLDGKCVPVRMHIFTHSDEGGEVSGYHGFAQAIPEKPIRLPKTLIDLDIEDVPPEPASTTILEPFHAVENHPSFQEVTTTSSLLPEIDRPLLQEANEGVPASVVIPFKMQNAAAGVIELVDEGQDRKWTEEERLLIQEVAQQLNLALENAQLYAAVQQELTVRTKAEKEISRRERYQKNIAQAVATLTELGTLALPEVLRLLGEASGTNRVAYFQVYAEEEGPYWQIVTEWHGEGVAPSQAGKRIGIGDHKFFSDQLSNQGYLAGSTADMADPLQNVLISLGIVSFLAISVPGKNATPGFILFAEVNEARSWGLEEIEALQVASAALSNTHVREDLLGQLESSLDETESLYNASRKLAVAGDIQTMLSSILESLPIPDINRVELLLNTQEPGAHNRIQVAGNWYNGTGKRPHEVGTEYDPAYFDFFYNRSQSLFINQFSPEDGAFSDIPEQLDEIASLAILPMWAGKRQVGVVLLMASQAHTFTEREIRSYPPLVSQMAIALENLRLFEQTQRSAKEAQQRSEELTLINRVVSAVASSLDLKAGLQTVITELGQAFDLTSGGIALLNADKTSLTLMADFAKDERTAVGMILPVGENTATKKVLNSRAPLIVPDAQHDPLTAAIHKTLELREIATLVILPLISGKEAIGTVRLDILDPRRVFTEDEMRLAETIIFQAAAAIQNARLFEQTQTALAETELLYKISRSVAQATSPRELLDLVFENALPRTANRITFLLAYEDQFGQPSEIEIVGSREVGRQFSQDGSRMPIQSFPLIEKIGADPILIKDLYQSEIDPASQQTLSRLNANTACLVGFHTAGRLTGMMVASSKQHTTFSEREVRFLQITGDAIAVALEKQRLLLEAQRRALELQTAAEIARDTSGTLALDILLKRIVNMLCERFEFYHAAIFLLDDSGSYAVVRESTGEAGEEMKKHGHKLAVGSQSVIGSATATGQPVVVNDVMQSELHRFNPLLPDTRAELGIPLKSGDRVIGALDVQSEEINSFHSDDVIVLQILSDQIAVAIDNARAYELSQKAVEEMREVDRVKSQFLANMSHELRTPLNSIIGFSRVILKGIDGPITDIQQQDLTAIYNSGQHLLRLINDILDLSKIEAGKMELAFEDVNIPDMVNSVMSTATGLVKDKAIKLVRKIPADLPTVHADPMRVRQVLINLLSNAAKFTDEGSITVEAAVQNSLEGKPEVILRVTDTGPGIAQDDQKKLFQPFSQVDDSPTRKTGGTGLGLSICRSLIEMHNGQIGLEKSEVGHGSTFFFTLPLPVPDPEPQVDVNGGQIVLSIDDDAQVISLYERYLRPNGYQVVALTDPTHAVEEARKIKPVAITLDVMMPNHDGWQVIKDLKADPETKDIPVIFCTILEQEEKGFSLGASDYLCKPILQEELLHALTRIERDGTVQEILVVDDDPDDLRLIQKILDNNPQYHLNLAKGGAQGWASISQNPPHAIIMDLFMPDFDGFTLLEKLRANPGLRDIPVIVLTGADLTPEQHRQLTSFGQDLLAKGLLKENELLFSLEKALSHPKKP